MAEPDRIRITPLDDKSEYTFWFICIIASIGAKGIDKVFQPKKKNGEALRSTATGTGCKASVEQLQQASIIML